MTTESVVVQRNRGKQVFLDIFVDTVAIRSGTREVKLPHHTEKEYQSGYPFCDMLSEVVRSAGESVASELEIEPQASSGSTKITQFSYMVYVNLTLLSEKDFDLDPFDQIELGDFAQSLLDTIREDESIKAFCRAFCANGQDCEEC